jgi:signal transduction histidine kinase
LRRAVLGTALASAGFSLLVETVLYLQGDSPAPARWVAAAAIVVAAVWGWRHDGRTEELLLTAAVFYGGLSLIDSASAAFLSPFDSATSLALMTLLGVVYLATHSGTQEPPVWVFWSAIALFTCISVLIERPPPVYALGRILIGGPGQILTLWLVSRLLSTVRQATDQQVKISRTRDALGTASHILLTDLDNDAVPAALQALLSATEADYAYVDVNMVDDRGRVTWKIVHDAIGDSVPPGPDAFGGGDYDDLEWVAELLGAGLPARIIVRDLPEPIRSRYVAEGIRAELAAPILIRDEWVGTVGFSDFWRDGEWSETEVDALMRAADMIAAYWQRHRAKEGLENLARAKDRFIAAVSHELRTPLSAVVGFAAELAANLEVYSSDDVREMVTLIHGQSREVANLVDDLLTVERAATGNLTIQATPVDLVSEIMQVVGAHTSEAHSVSVLGEPAGAWCDALRVRQIIRNLVSNAYRYGGERVEVGAEAMGDTSMVWVADNGPGIDDVDASRIFDPYYRSRPDQALPDSVGLGLAVARQLARLMGGDLVYRRVAGWTRFELTVPAEPSTNQVMHPALAPLGA